MSIIDFQLCNWMVCISFVPWPSHQLFALPTLPKLNPLTLIKYLLWKGDQKTGMKFQIASVI